MRTKLTDDALIAGCLKGKARYQKALYEKYGPQMMAVCERYAGNSMEAEDNFHEAFMNVFRKINQYKGGSFYSWMRRIFINVSINNYHKHKKHYYQNDIDEATSIESANASSISQMSEAELMSKIDKLPQGCRTVFCLYVIDGYKHIEIAEMLGISEGTSKSQLFKAREMLKKAITKEQLVNVNY